MPDNNTPDTLETVKIWQQNCRKSLQCQLDLINSLDPRKYDICLIQEPYIDHLGNTRAPPNWTAIYPPTHRRDDAPQTRSVILISPAIGANVCIPIPIDSPDITAIQLETHQGSVRIINIYNDINHSDTIEKICTWQTNPTAHTSPPTPLHSTGRMTHTLWAGDFNRHHPTWDDKHQEHLFTAAAIRDADILLNAIAEAGLAMMLPKGINTLCTPQGDWTHPDNVFASHELTDLISICTVDPSNRLIITDHLPIYIELEVGISRTGRVESYVWKEVDWKEFEKDLAAALKAHGPPRILHSVLELEHAAILMEHIFAELTAKHVRTVTISPHTKRWWNADLSAARQHVRKLKLRAFKKRDEEGHPIHDEMRRAANAYKQLIKETKRDSWTKFIENARDFSIWLVHKTVTGTGSDGGQTRLPTLQDVQPDGTRTSHRILPSTTSPRPEQQPRHRE
jgi:hypothetical protein